MKLLWMLIGILVALSILSLAMVRYPVGQAVPVEVYTAPYDPCDAVYKFLQPAPADWTKQFGNNERTCLIHSISELRVVVANMGKVVAEQGEKIKALEAFHVVDPNATDPNGVEE